MTPDQLALAVATTLVTQGTMAAVTAGRSAATALTRLVRERLARRRGGDEALRAALDQPEDQRQLTVLTDVLARAIADDPEFAIHLRTLVAELRPGSDLVVNHFSGSSAKVVQARDIVGDLTL